MNKPEELKAGRIVPLDERLREAHKRNVTQYSSTAQSKLNAARVDALIFKLEAEIFAGIGLNPLEVTDKFVDSQLNQQ